MCIAVIGVNHSSCPIEIREKVTFTHSKQLEGLQVLKAAGIKEIVILSTCNRSEIYFYNEDLAEAINKVISFYGQFLEEAVTGAYFYIKQGQEALEHLFKVSAGLDSIVLGEDQILGQVKEAFCLALEGGFSEKILNKVFREAITTAKHIKTEMGISNYALSISHIAVKFLKEKRRSLKGLTGLIIGTGQMNQLTVKYLLNEQVGKLYVANRTHTKAVSLTECYSGLVPILYEQRYEVLPDVDFVFSATASAHIILKKEQMPTLYKPLDIMDIAMPRDIDPRLEEQLGIEVYDVDDLKQIAKENNRFRREAATAAQLLIDQAIKELMKWLRNLEMEPVILGLYEKCEQIQHWSCKQIDKLELAGAEKKEITHIIETALQKLVRGPIATLTAAETKTQQAYYASALTELFKLSER